MFMKIINLVEKNKKQLTETRKKIIDGLKKLNLCNAPTSAARPKAASLT